MAPGSSHGSDSELTPTERDRLAALRSAESLADLVALTGADSERDAYRAARREWADLRERELAARPPEDGLPGNRVVIDGRDFWVHGVTHADTAAERELLRERVSAFLDRGAAVYCEQGVRSMYFDDLPAVCEMDDLSWALRRCDELDDEFSFAGIAAFAESAVADLAGVPAEDVAESTVADLTESTVGELTESTVGELAESTVGELAADLDALADRFRTAAFSFVDAHSDLYGEEIAVALGGLASALLASRADVAVGDDYESFATTRRAARDPDALGDLQRYYETTFLPQPVEREWLRRHDPELELLTHARNERMAAYAVYHVEDAEEAHLIVGAAHQPGVTYYLEQYRDGEWTVEDFEFVE